MLQVRFLILVLGTAVIQLLFLAVVFLLKPPGGEASQTLAADKVQSPPATETDLIQQEFALLQPQSIPETSIDSDPVPEEIAEPVESELPSVPEEGPSEPAVELSVKEYSIKSGDTLSSIWHRFGAPAIGAINAAKALKENKLSLSIIRAGDKVLLTITEEHDIVALEYGLPKGKTLKLNGDSKSGYEVEISEPKISRSEQHASGVISSSFFAAAAQEQVPYQVIDDFVDLFSGQVEFRRSIQPGDCFTIVYDESATEKGDVVDFGPVRAAVLETQGKRLVALHYRGEEGKDHYFDQNGELVGNYFLRYPLKFSRISSSFSHSRLHPILKIRRPHHGVDFAAPSGTPVRSVADGVVIFAGYSKGAGKYIKVRHSDRYTTAYLHLSSFARGIRKGARVTRGEMIGRVGSTGLSTGPHLDFRLYDKGRSVDPLKVELPRMPSDHIKLPENFIEKQLDHLMRYHQAASVVVSNQGKPTQANA